MPTMLRELEFGLHVPCCSPSLYIMGSIGLKFLHERFYRIGECKMKDHPDKSHNLPPQILSWF